MGSSGRGTQKRGTQKGKKAQKEQQTMQTQETRPTLLRMASEVKDCESVTTCEDANAPVASQQQQRQQQGGGRPSRHAPRERAKKEKVTAVTAGTAVTPLTKPSSPNKKKESKCQEAKQEEKEKIANKQQQRTQLQWEARMNSDASEVKDWDSNKMEDDPVLIQAVPKATTASKRTQPKIRNRGSSASTPRMDDADEVLDTDSFCNDENDVEPQNPLKRKQSSGSTAILSSLDSDNSTNTDNNTKKDEYFSDRWTRWNHQLRRPLLKGLLAVTDHAARHPLAYFWTVLVVSFALAIVGYSTNFRIEAAENELWTPIGSRAREQGTFFFRKAGFPSGTERVLMMIVHADSEDVVQVNGVERVFEAIDVVRSTPRYHDVCAFFDDFEIPVELQCPPGYDAVCAMANFTAPKDPDEPSECPTRSVASFWDNNREFFDLSLSSQSDQELALKQFLSADFFPSDSEVNLKDYVGYPVLNEAGLLMNATSFSIFFSFPPVPGVLSFERDLVDLLLQKQAEWDEEEGGKYVLDFFAGVSFPDEFTRGIVKDIPLIPLVFVVMSVFTMIVFSKRDWIQSRSLLGFGAVATVLLSITTGYGLLFLIGVPFTSLTQVLPFIMFGIGLDDAFILYTAYVRTDTSKTSEERVHDTVTEVGISILMTTATSVVAFGLGCMSTVPAIRWLCLYAFPTILIDFFYQISFFIALIVLDERRVRARRRDCLACYKVPERDDEDGQEVATPAPPVEEKELFAQKFMGWYTDFLLQPIVKVIVLVSFAALFVFCAYSATKLYLVFDFTSVLPSDSYIIDFTEALLDQTSRAGVSPAVLFRHVDQSDPEIQKQMIQYVDELVETDYITDPPFKFWLREYQTYIAANETLQSMPFYDSLDIFLEDPDFKDFKEDIVFQKNTDRIRVSRTKLVMDQVDQKDAKQILDAFRQQREVGARQPINKNGNGTWSFFNFDAVYFLWEFLAITGRELAMTTILGVGVVSVMAIIFLPHWSGVVVVGPMIAILYVDLMGVLQFAGLGINGVSYVALVMSIGLLVDFIMHMALRYYESTEVGRDAKTRDMLQTMGVGVLLGGMSTLLGILPLALTSSEIFNTFFITFLGIVTLGIGHGLILFPVVFSLIGPRADPTRPLMFI